MIYTLRIIITGYVRDFYEPIRVYDSRETAVLEALKLHAENRRGDPYDRVGFQLLEWVTS